MYKKDKITFYKEVFEAYELVQKCYQTLKKDSTIFHLSSLFFGVGGTVYFFLDRTQLGLVLVSVSVQCLYRKKMYDRTHCKYPCPDSSKQTSALRRSFLLQPARESVGMFRKCQRSSRLFYRFDPPPKMCRVIVAHCM